VEITYRAPEPGRTWSRVPLERSSPAGMSSLGFSLTTSHMLSILSLKGPQGRSEGLSPSDPTVVSKGDVDRRKGTKIVP